MNALSTIVTAGAGAGKTYRLVSEIVDALLGVGVAKPLSPERILALTFTDKAAMEMKERVHGRLCQYLEQGYDEALLQRASSQGLQLPDVSGLAELLKQAERSVITTYHAFCSKLLRKYANRFGAVSDFVLQQPYDEKMFAANCAERVVLMGLLEEGQSVAELILRLKLRQAFDSYGLVEHLVAIRDAHIEHGKLILDPVPKDAPLDPDQIKAYLAAISDALMAFPDKLSPKAHAKLHEAQEKLQQLSAVLGAPQLSEVALSFAYSQLTACLSGRFGPDQARQNLSECVQRLGTYLCDGFTCHEEHTFGRLLFRFDTALRAQKRASGRLCFSDLLLFVREGLALDVALRREIKLSFDRILVDEYQDTSPIQEDLVALLAESRQQEAVVQIGQSILDQVELESGKLFVVGDPKQSIYGFRGSDVHLFAHLQSQLQKSGREETLNLNRRSQGKIVALVNQVAEQTLNLSADGVRFEERDALLALKPSLEVAGARLVGPSAAQMIADEIEAVLQQRSAVAVHAGAQRFLAGQVAVLCRRIKQARPIVDALKARGIAAQLFGGEGFYQRSEIQDVVAALQLLVDPMDTVSLLCVAKSPFLNMTTEQVAHAASQLQQQGLPLALTEWLEVCLGIDGVKEEVQQFAHCVEHLRLQLCEKPLAHILDHLLEETGYLSRVKEMPQARQILANVRKLRDGCLLDGLPAPVHIMRLVQKLKDAPAEALADDSIAKDAVQVMTIHQSKGLEFEIVFLADTGASVPSNTDDVVYDPELGVALTYKGRPIAVCAPQKPEQKAAWPVRIQKVRARKRSREEAELARLLYVALTRAKTLVYFVDEQAGGGASGLSLKKLFDKAEQAQPEQFALYLPTVSEWPKATTQALPSSDEISPQLLARGTLAGGSQEQSDRSLLIGALRNLCQRMRAEPAALKDEMLQDATRMFWQHDKEEVLTDACAAMWQFALLPLSAAGFEVCVAPKDSALDVLALRHDQIVCVQFEVTDQVLLELSALSAASQLPVALAQCSSSQDTFLQFADLADFSG